MSLQSEHCAACHKIILMQHGAPPSELMRAGWILTGKGIWFCSEAHMNQGRAMPIRENSGVTHMRFDPRTKPTYRLGAYAAVQGFDVVSKEPEYVRGHAFGMQVREIAKAAGEKADAERAPKVT